MVCVSFEGFEILQVRESRAVILRETRLLFAWKIVKDSCDFNKEEISQ